jgi:uncharacterized BrkB/YihY/UPF0761 family membrane protein
MDCCVASWRPRPVAGTLRRPCCWRYRLATALWWLVSLLLVAYVSESRDFGETYGPLTGVMALLLWANLTGTARFVGVAFAAQLEATRVGSSGPGVVDQDSSPEERSEPTLTSRT